MSTEAWEEIIYHKLYAEMALTGAVDSHSRLQFDRASILAGIISLKCRCVEKVTSKQVTAVGFCWHPRRGWQGWLAALCFPCLLQDVATGFDFNRQWKDLEVSWHRSLASVNIKATTLWVLPTPGEELNVCPCPQRQLQHPKRGDLQ